MSVLKGSFKGKIVHRQCEISNVQQTYLENFTWIMDRKLITTYTGENPDHHHPPPKPRYWL